MHRELVPSEPSSFERRLPQDVESVRIELPRGLKCYGSLSVAGQSGSLRVPTKVYNVTVEPNACQRKAKELIREHSRPCTSEYALQPRSSGELSFDSVYFGRDAHTAPTQGSASSTKVTSIHERTCFKAERAHKFAIGRYFPALANPSLVPTYRLPNGRKRREQLAPMGDNSPRAGSSSLPQRKKQSSTLMDPTFSKTLKHESKRDVITNLPFLSGAVDRGPSSNMISDRGPALFSEFYETPREVQKEEYRSTKDRWKHGTFKPNSSKTNLLEASSVQAGFATYSSASASSWPPSQALHGSADGSQLDPSGAASSSLARVAKQGTAREVSEIQGAPPPVDPYHDLRAIVFEWLENCNDNAAVDFIVATVSTVVAEETPGASGQTGILATKLRDSIWDSGEGAPNRTKREALTDLVNEMVSEVKDRKELGDFTATATIHEQVQARANRASKYSSAPSGTGTRHSRVRRNSSKESVNRKRPVEQSCFIPVFSAPVAGSLAAMGNSGLTSEEKEIKKAAELAHERVWRSAFAKLADDGKVHLDDSVKTFELMGFFQPDFSWIQEAWKTITGYTQLGVEDFLAVARFYESRERAGFLAAFNACDVDGSGTVEEIELESLLKSFNVEPMKHVLEEVILEVDEDRSGVLNFQEFEKVLARLKVREGFTKKEHEVLMDVFARFDRDGSKEMDAQELIGVLGWLGYSFSSDAVSEIVKLVDVDASGLINEREFLVCMRMVREREIEKLRAAIMANDADGSGTIQYNELENLIRALGYYPDSDSVQEAADDAGISKDDNDLDLSELWLLLQIFRSREGFNRAEAMEIETAFTKFDRRNGNTGEISVLEIGKVIRSAGYPLPFEQQQNITSKVDVDGSGKLDLSELRKMVRMVRDMNIDSFRDAFAGALDRQLGSGDDDTWVSIENAKAELRTLKCATQEEQNVNIAHEDIVRRKSQGDALGTDIYGFVRTAIRCYKDARRSFRQNGGFTTKEISEMRVTFDMFDMDRSGDIGSGELIALIEKLFPEMASKPELRPQLVQLIGEADINGDGSLDFADFLRMMRQFNDLQDRYKITKESSAIQETRFSSAEVSEFRELFLAQGEGRCELTLAEVKEMVSLICPMGDKFASELASIFRETSKRQQGVEGRRDRADFPEFLWFMRTLLDMNFGNIRERTNSAPVVAPP